MQSLTIQIPQPCHERWDDMQPHEQGRFCANCQKMVVDYTALSDRELVKLLTKPLTTSCGRFRDEQLNRPLLVANPVATSVWRQWLGFLTLSLFGWQTARAQQSQTDRSSRPVAAQQASIKVEAAVKPIPVRTTVGPETMSVIAGKVIMTDSSGSPLPAPYAHVFIDQPGHKWQASTDSTGAYKLLLPTRLLTGHLTVYARTPNRWQGNITFDVLTSAPIITLNDLVIEEKPVPIKAITGGGICLLQTPSRWQKFKRRLFH
ncbi:carboxypeptidase-like regulatory domain-containing protein [Spirosoma jeollabukense]